MNNPRCFLALGAAFLMAVAGMVKAGDDPVLDLVAIGTLEVGPDGSVLDYTLENDLEPAVATLVDRTVRDWAFEPVLVDGKPVIAVTRMRLELEAVPRGDEYALRVADVVLGAPEPVDFSPPVYPLKALHDDIGAQVSLLLQVDANGRVQQVHVEQVSLSGRPGKRASYYRERFADVSRKTALQWTYAMGEQLDGGPVAAVFRVPVTFAPGGPGDWVERPEYVPGPMHPSPWADADVPAAGTRMLEDGEVQPLDSRMKLRDDVVGQML